MGFANWDRWSWRETYATGRSWQQHVSVFGKDSTSGQKTMDIRSYRKSVFHFKGEASMATRTRKGRVFSVPSEHELRLLRCHPDSWMFRICRAGYVGSSQLFLAFLLDALSSAPSV